MRVLPFACAGAFVVGLVMGRPAPTASSDDVRLAETDPATAVAHTAETDHSETQRRSTSQTADAERPQAPQAAGSPAAATNATPEANAPTQPRALASAEAPGAVTPPSPAPPPRPRSRRRSRRNIYPGPIPTPADWEPPPGPIRIALQAGHWRANEAPAELRGLRDNGTRWRNMPEWEANLEIAERAGAMLEDLGYEVDILPAVVPKSYRAHLFIAIHADGSNDPRATGYRVAAPGRDATGRASRIANLLEDSYGQATGIRRLEDTTRRMRNYYAFNFRRYQHALHPMTIAVIIETGFLTSARDRRVIVDAPDRAARGIVDAVKAFDITPPPATTIRAHDTEKH